MKKRLLTLKKNIGFFLHETAVLLKGNHDKILLFIFGYTIICFMMTQTIMDFVIDGMTRVSGQSYLGPDNLIGILTNPVSLIVILVSVFLMTYLSVFEIAGLIHAYGMAKIGKRTTLKGMIGAGMAGCARITSVRNWSIVPFIVLLIPLTNVLSLSGVFMAVQIPEFIQDYIIANDLYRWLYRFVCLILILLEFFLLYAVNFFLMADDVSFFKACKESIQLVRNDYIRTIFYLLLVEFLFALAADCVSGIVSDLVSRIVVAAGAGGSITRNYYTISAINMTKQALTGIFLPAINLATLTVLFYQLIEEKNMLVRLSRNNFSDQSPKKYQVVILTVCVVAALGTNLYASRNMIANWNEPVTKPAVVAHRGDSVRAPENTMPAFELALEEGVEWVELDVHQTKDGVVMVSHDEDLKRVSGKDLKVSELTYEETRDLDVGSWFSSEFSYVRLSTLDEVLKLFKNTNVTVQIEIKADGPTENLVQRTIQVIRDNGMESRVYFTSLEKSILEEIKAQDTDIPTVYSMYVAGSDITDIDCADDFTIEEGNYTRQLVENIHAQGKLCFAWTANTEDTAQYLVDCGVDGILTDDPVMMNRALDQADYSGGIMHWIRLALNHIVDGF